MRALIILVLIILLGSCVTKKNLLNTYSEKGYSTFNYTFSDNQIRNLEISFVNDTILEVYNKVEKTHAPSYYLFNFKLRYSFESIRIGVVKIKNLIDTNVTLSNDKYLVPFSRNVFKSQVDIFPDIEGDTIRFSNDLSKLQIREFNFDIKGYK